jgi:hypothetical protein
MAATPRAMMVRSDFCRAKRMENALATEFMSEDKNLNFTFCGQYLIDIQDPKIYISNINKPCPINQLP